MDSLWTHKVLLLLWLSPLPAVAALKCYNRQGILATSSEFYNSTDPSFLIPYGDESGPTTCCFKNQFCSTDLLCHEHDGGIYRQYCSDPTWPEDKCSHLCPGFEEAGVQAIPCDNTNTKFCCGVSDECCKNNNYTEIDPNTGRIVAIGTSSIVLSSSATPTPSFSSSSATGPSASAATTGTAADGEDSIDKQAKLGIGLGVGLGVPLIGSIAAALFLWHRSLLSQARSGANGGGSTSSLHQMVESSSPVPENQYGQDASPAAAAPGTPGREAELNSNSVAYQLESERNARFELGERSIHELR